MRELSVGSCLYPSRSVPEGVAVDAAQSWLVVISLADPSPVEVRAVSSGAVDLAIAREGAALIWCVRVDGCLDWSSSAWAWWERTAPEAPVDRPGVGGIATLLLCDASTTKIRAMRTVGLTLRVAAAIRDLEAQAQAAGRDETSLAVARSWALAADAATVEARARAAAVVTGVPAKAS